MVTYRTSTRISAQIVGGTGIDVERENGIYTVSIDISEFVDLPSVDSEDEDDSFLPFIQEIGDTTFYGKMSFSNFAAQITAAFGSVYQPLDATLTAWAGVTFAADKIGYATGADAFSTTDLTSFARTILDDTTAGAVLTTLGVSAFAQTVLDDTTAAAARTTLGAGDVVGIASSNASSAARFDGTSGKLLTDSPLIVADTTGSLSRSGNGGIPVQGTNTNDDAAAGYVGEFQTAARAIGSALSLSSTTAADITSVSLTAGDWDVWGTVAFVGVTNPAVTFSTASVSTTSATLDTTVGRLNTDLIPFSAGTSIWTKPVGPSRFSLSGTTTVYLVGRVGFSSNNVDGYGSIFARRVR
jgi:hypothetical protein